MLIEGEGQNRTMKRQRKEGGQNPSPTLHLSTFATAANAISECIQELSKMLDCFAQGESIGSLDMEQRQVEILRIKSSVLRRLEMLLEEPEEGGQNPLPTCQGRKFLRSCLPTARIAISTISECITDLCKLQQLILRREKSILQEESLYEEALGIKSGVECQLKMLWEETEEADGEAMDVEGPDEDENGEGSDEDEDVESSDEDQFESYCYPSSWWPLSQKVTMFNTEVVEPWQLKKVEFVWSGVNKKEMKENERYLCVSNGFAIWCLDLNLSKSNTPYLPIIGILNLMGEQLPASVGLFKLGSDAYMIGGQELPASVKGRVYSIIDWGRSPQGINLYQALCISEGIKGSSRVSYRLSLAANKDGTRSLYHSKAGNIEELKQPKVWPIVEKIGEKLHVMDSVPALLCGVHDGTFSHEVGNLECHDWEAITPTFEDETVHIISHMVVGNRIYAVTSPGSRRYYYIWFDSGTGKWEGYTRKEWCPALEAKRLWDILRLGFGRCAGEYRHGGGGPYMVVAIVRDCKNCPDYFDNTLAVAYLVTSTGQVVCYQVLPDFFEQPLHPREMQGGTMFHVEAGPGLGLGRTMCSVFSARIKQDDFSRDYLFINTFSVEVLPDAADKVEQLLVKNASEVQPGPAVEQKFVRVTRKGWCIYETDADLKFCKENPRGQFVGWQACFLTPPPS